MTWQQHAACRDADPDIFFDLARRAEAADLCRQCSVVLPCREAGAEEHGWWGGRVGKGDELEYRRDYQRRRRLSEKGIQRRVLTEVEQPPLAPWTKGKQLLHDIETSGQHARKRF